MSKKAKSKKTATSSNALDSLQEKVKALEKKLMNNNAVLLNIVGKSLDAILILDKNKMVVYANYAAIQLFDRDLTDLLGEPLDLPFDENFYKCNGFIKEIKISHKNGCTSIVEAFVLEAEWNGKPGYVVSFRDITERRKTEIMLEHLSQYDYLTDLPNRVYFEKFIENAINYSKEHNEYLALLYLDLDNFKMVNDTLGHVIGDMLLKEVSNVLRQTVRKTDVVARLGGDEFAIILTGLKRPDYAATVANNIVDKLFRPFLLDGNELFANTSIGIAVYPFSGTSSVDLIKNADAAMYAAKKNGKNQYWFFSDELKDYNQQHAIVMQGLRAAIRREEFLLYYQPIIDVSNLECVGVEALLRWQHPKLGLLAPDQFLQDAREMHMMSTIGKWVVSHALREFSIYQKILPKLFISINLSIQELEEGIAAENFILGEIKNLNLPVSKVVLELTETSVMSNPQASVKILNRLSKIGVRIAVDDYGTGYSSLSYFKQLPVSILKIDKSFVNDLWEAASDAAIVQSTIQLSHDLGLKVVAEGVETESQFKFLKNVHCDFVQGYYFARPMPFEEICHYLTTLAKKNTNSNDEK